MVESLSVDTHTLAKKLKAAASTDSQTDALAEALVHLVSGELVTECDLKN